MDCEVVDVVCVVVVCDYCGNCGEQVDCGGDECFGDVWCDVCECGLLYVCEVVE